MRLVRHSISASLRFAHKSFLRVDSQSRPRLYSSTARRYRGLSGIKTQIDPTSTARVREHSQSDLAAPPEIQDNHDELDLDRLERCRYIIRESINKSQEQLLAASLKEFLPLDQDPDRALQSWPLLGHQQVHFRPWLTKNQLLQDGTDIKFLPGPCSKWPFRLWAGGSVSLLADPQRWVETLDLTQHEFVQDYRIVGKPHPDRVFVTVRKEIGHLSTPATFSRLQQGNTEGWNALLAETYTLCFLEKLPGGNSAKIVKPPSNAAFTHTMKPTLNLLFQFSALTHNAHRIHLDPSYAQEEYGMKTAVVHGPLLMVLMLEFLRISLQSYRKEPDKTLILCKHIDYRNYAPLYVDESFILCCKPSKKEDLFNPAQAKEWQVWIQTGSGDDASLAVRGTVEVTTFPEE